MEMKEEIAEYFMDIFGYEIRKKLGTAHDGDSFDLHIQTYPNRDTIVELIQQGNYGTDRKIDIDLGRICIYDDYDLDEAQQRFGEDFDDEVESDAFWFFKENFDFERYIEEKIEEQLTPEQVKRLYKLIFYDEDIKEWGKMKTDEPMVGDVFDEEALKKESKKILQKMVCDRCGTVGKWKVVIPDRRLPGMQNALSYYMCKNCTNMVLP